MRRARIAAVFLAAAAAGACRDTLAPADRAPGGPAPQGDAGYTVAKYLCTGAQATLRCDEMNDATAPAGQRRIMLGQGRVKLTSFNVVYDSVAEVLSADVTVQNLRTHAIGTSDGTSVAFIKAFFHDGPKVTAYRAPGDTGTVTVLNADGTCNCSAADQPYFNYPEILQPNQVSAAKNWHWRLPKNVTGWSFVLYVFTRFPGEVDIPATPPDTVPASLYDSGKVVKGDTADSGWFLRDVVLLGFKPGATAEERLAAVNWTNGTVVGGMQVGTGGIYFVRVPDDGTTTNLNLALGRLKKLPQVAFSGREYVEPAGVSEGASARPDDGSGWAKGDWTLKPDSAGDRGNWGMEAVAAPQAWGCTTGDSAVSIGIVDEDFYELSDVGELAPGQLGGDNLLQHGTRVLAVLAARGDNQQGMAGMIWDLHRQEYNIANTKESEYVPRSGVLRLLWESIYDDHRVINLSLQARYTDSVTFLPRSPNPASHADSMHAEHVGEMTASLILTALLPGNDPLIVISAGNYGMDAYWGGYAQAVKYLPDRVIVVGGAEYAGPGQGDNLGSFRRAAWSTTPDLHPDIGSNWGELVDVYAPGRQVGTLARYGGDVPLRNDGTSFSAPIVSGIAGLMLSLDPTLTAKEMKDLIIEGGQRGGRVVINGLNEGAQYRYVANAYESLRAVAERPGAGVCGNMMYRDSTGTTFARRVQNGVASWEPVFQEGWGGLSPQHRKRQVRLSNGNVQLWRGGQWTLFATTDPADNATYLSRLGKSHDADTTVTVVKRRISQFQEDFDILLNGTLLTTVTGPPVNNPTGIAPTRCVAWDLNGSEWDSCYSEARNQPDYRTTTWSVAYSSARHEVLLAVVRDSSSWKVDLGEYVYAGLWQRNYSYDTYSIDTKLYFIPVGNPAAVRTAVSRGYRLSNFGFSDDGTHLVMRSAIWAFTNSYTPDETFSYTTKTCEAVFSQVWDYSLVHEDRTPNNSSLQCYPDATYAP